MEGTSLFPEQIITPENPFSSESWSESASPAPEQAAEPAETTQNNAAAPANTAIAEPAKTEDTEEIFDENVWIKKEFGWENAETGKAELEELRKRQKIEFANAESEKAFNYLKEGKVDDLYNFLDQKKKINTLTTDDINNRAVAAELVKFGIQNRNKDLTQDEVDFLFNKKFNIPPKPQQTAETDEEYAELVAGWEQRVNDINKELVIEAKLARPELEKLKSELVLPDIKKEADPAAIEAQQKELQRIEAIKGQFLQSLESDFNKFGGYEMKYKDEEVEIPVSFVVSDAEKTALKEELKNFNVDDFLDKRWFSEKDGSPNISQIMQDITLLRKRDEVMQKMINEVGSKMKEHYIKLKGNVNVTGNPQQTFQPNGEKSSMDKQIEYIWTH